MLLESLEVKDFRNLNGTLTPSSGLNILIGDNGQGKTNCLEAIYLLSTTRSFKTAKPQEAIRFAKNRHPELVVIADTCLCQYTDHGHCGALEPRPGQRNAPRFLKI